MRRKFIHLKNKYNNILITDDGVNILYSDGQSIDSIYYLKIVEKRVGKVRVSK